VRSTETQRLAPLSTIGVTTEVVAPSP
jgi:hypothetical protein